ncbi:MAG: hypothetical protein ACRD0V_02775 [Acidimicrobiales bacterium]
MLLPYLAETEAARQALQGRTAGLGGADAFAIGLGVASGDIAVATYQRYRERVLAPAGGAVAERLSTYVLGPAGRAWRHGWRRRLAA